MKSKISIIILIVLIVAGIVGYNLLFGEKEIGTEKNTNEIEDTESKVEEKINEELEFEQEFLESLLCQKNTYYSVVRNYKDNYEEILDKYCTEYTEMGNSAAWMENESNYKQYEQEAMGEVELENMTDNINIKLAQVHESTCNLEKYNEEMSLEEVVKLQSAEGTDYTGELIGKDGYFEITGMLIMNGNNTSEEEWKNNSRAKKISVIINGEEEYGYDLEDTMEVQLIDLNYCQESIGTPIDIEIKVLDTYEGEKTQDVYISDIRFGFDSSVSGAR